MRTELRFFKNSVFFLFAFPLHLFAKRYCFRAFAFRFKNDDLVFAGMKQRAGNVKSKLRSNLPKTPDIEAVDPNAAFSPA